MRTTFGRRPAPWCALAVFAALAAVESLQSQTTGPVRFRNTGVGCPGSTGQVPRLWVLDPPDLGSSFSFGVTGGAPSSLAFLLLGGTSANVGLGGLGAPGCTVRVAPISAGQGLLDRAGTGQQTLPVPNDPSLVALSLHAQWAVLDPNANALGLALSGAGIARLDRPGPMPFADAAELVLEPGTQNTVLRAQMRGSLGLGGFTIDPDGAGAGHVLRDDGLAPDTRAGDGIFHGVVQANFGIEGREFDRRVGPLLQGQIQQVPVFERREFERFVPVSSLPLIRTGIRIPIFTEGLGFDIDPARSLVINSTSVVEDPDRTWNSCTQSGNPDGPWTFKHLMTEMCNQPVSGVDPRDFVEAWMRTFTVDQPLNGFNAPRRRAAQAFLSAWPRDGMGKLVLERAPFRLLAIVNRVDLRSRSFYGGGDAGEGRLVFGAVRCPGGAPEQFTVIFEYAVPHAGCFAVKNWARQWANLSTLPLGSPAYNAALESITRQFTDRNAAPTKPNGSALAQLRTNEIALGLLQDWELREFKIDAGALTPAVTALTPDLSFDNSPLLTPVVNGICPAPTEIPMSFLGPASQADSPGFHWLVPGVSNDDRHCFSLNTCNGCHAGETGTVFTHISPAAFGAPAPLSGFLVGDGAGGPFMTPDPASGVPRPFWEFERRRKDLASLAQTSCFFDILHRSLRRDLLMIH